MGYIRQLENRIVMIESEQKTEGGPGPKTDPYSEGTEDLEDEGRPHVQLDAQHVIPKVRKCTLEQFKNRFTEEEGNYAVEVLVSDSHLEQDIHEEHELRHELFKRKAKSKGKASAGKPSLIAAAANLVGKAHLIEKSEVKWISRVRIQSPAILSIFARVVRESWSTQPRTFLRPFRSLIYFQGKMEEALSRLESKWGNVENGSSGAATPSVDGEDHSHCSDGHHYHVDDSSTALADMRCFVDFMRREIMPLYTRFQEPDCTPRTKIRFEDLWYLFRTGELVYRPTPNDTEKTNAPLYTRQRAWRVYGIKLPTANYRISHDDHRKYAHHERDESSDFKLLCYHIDYTGEEFCVVSEEIVIPYFDGEKPISTLTVYPFRFVTNAEQTLEAFEKVGANFLKYIKTKHLTYNWWTLILNPKGDPAMDMDGNLLKHPEHVNSEVIVDFAEAFQVCPLWTPMRSVMPLEEANPATSADDFYIRWWSDTNRTKLLAESTELVEIRSGVTAYQRNQSLKEDPLLNTIRENDKLGRLTTESCLRKCDYALLPIRVFAYVLQDRKFVQLDSQRLRFVKETFNAFDSLKINPEYKGMVKALVQAHFMKKAMEKRVGTEGMTQDLIQGKGKGLFILLHGVPGVGKTATAEATAQANGKPLFSITCGDLGLTPKEVESSLRGIFRLAHLWDCVLLLDEVDTFFSQRSKADTTLTKNALVSGKHIPEIFSVLLWGWKRGWHHQSDVPKLFP